MSLPWFPNTVRRCVGDTMIEQSGEGLPLVFVHINKTAGTSLTQYLRENLTDPSAMAPPWLGDYDAIGLDNPEFQMFWGHFPFARFRERRSEGWFITFLRDPVQRVVSQYRSLHNPENLKDGWEKVLPEHARRAMQFAQQASFDEFIMTDDPFIVGHIQDLQTLFLSSQRSPSHPEFLSSAIDNLENRFLFFGITERFQESIELFQHQFVTSVPYNSDQHDRNISQQYEATLNAEVHERLNRLVENDRKLYDRALACFEQRMQTLRSQPGASQECSARRAS